MRPLIRAVIDSHALRHNLRIIRARTAGARVIAVVKANAYGHGLVSTALALSEVADALAVARLEEALALRAAGIGTRILLLEGVFSFAELTEAVYEGLDLVVHDASQVELLERADAAAARCALWLKIDTGMNRLGFAPREFAAALVRIRNLSPAPRELRLLTHLACANERDDQATRAQLERFREATRGLDYEVSIANSAGIFGAVPLGCHWVRPGLALYGASPFTDCSADSLGLKPVMTLVSSVITVRRVARGESVGYGDGVHRSLANGATVLVNGSRAPLTGRVSMDMLAVDVSALEGVRVGTPVVLWGEGLPVEEAAQHAGTIAYELLCSVSPRVPLEPR